MRAIRYTLERVRTPNVVRERKTINFLEINLSCHRAQAIFIYFLYTKDSLMPKIYRKGGREWNSNIYRKEALSLRWTFLWFLSMSLRHSTNLFSWHNKNLDLNLIGFWLSSEFYCFLLKSYDENLGDYIMSHLIFTARWTWKAKRAYYVDRNVKPNMMKLIFYVWNVYHKVFHFSHYRKMCQFTSHYSNLKPSWEKCFREFLQEHFLPKQLVPNLLFELNLCAVFLWDFRRVGSIIWHAGGRDPKVLILTIW